MYILYSVVQYVCMNTSYIIKYSDVYESSTKYTLLNPVIFNSLPLLAFLLDSTSSLSTTLKKILKEKKFRSPPPLSPSPSQPQHHIQPHPQPSCFLFPPFATRHISNLQSPLPPSPPGDPPPINLGLGPRQDRRASLPPSYFKITPTNTPRQTRTLLAHRNNASQQQQQQYIQCISILYACIPIIIPIPPFRTYPYKPTAVHNNRPIARPTYSTVQYRDVCTEKRRAHM